MDNTTVVCKIGETGKVFTFTLKESNTAGAQVAKDLTGYTAIKMQVESSDGTVIMDQVDCVVSSPATAGIITCTTDIATATHPGLVAGTHNLEFSGLNAAGKKRYWPLNEQAQRTFGKMVVQAALA